MKGVIVHFFKRDFDERAFKLNRVLVIQILRAHDIAASDSTVLLSIGNSLDLILEPSSE